MNKKKKNNLKVAFLILGLVKHFKLHTDGIFCNLQECLCRHKNFPWLSQLYRKRKQGELFPAAMSWLLILLSNLNKIALLLTYFPFHYRQPSMESYLRRMGYYKGNNHVATYCKYCKSHQMYQLPFNTEKETIRQLQANLNNWYRNVGIHNLGSEVYQIV